MLGQIRDEGWTKTGWGLDKFGTRVGQIRDKPNIGLKIRPQPLESGILHNQGLDKFGTTKEGLDKNGIRVGQIRDERFRNRMTFYFLPCKADILLHSTRLPDTLMSQFDLFRENSGEAKPWSDFVIDGVDTRPRKWIVIHNEVVLARLDWSIQMNRIFSALVSQIAMDDDRFVLQRIRVKDLRDLAEVTTNTIHKSLADATQRLVREPIEFRTPDHRYEGHPIFATCRYVPGEGYIEARFNDDAKEYLLQLRRAFTKYKLKTVMKLSSAYAVRFYQIAKMIQRDEGPRKRTIDIDDFRKLFVLTDKYTIHRDLQRRVIMPSVEEVNEKTDTKLSVETVREGDSKYAPVSGLSWTVWPSHDPDPPKKAAPKKRTSKGKPKRLLERSKPDAFESWFQSLPKKKRSELWQKACQMTAEEGSDPNGKAFHAYAQIKLRAITRKMRQ